ncbi:hypothetical protein MASR2M117_25080 [Paludibacter sp.]
MGNNTIIEKIISNERLQPYLTRHKNNQEKAIQHYKSNIFISEAFYPLLSILEIGLRNSIDYQLMIRFKDKHWFENHEFIKIASKFQIDRVSEARVNILSEKKEITSGRIISELSFGFWTSLFDTKFEMTLWKTLRLAFPNCPKEIRKRRTMSSKFNALRKLRNRIFHHEAVTWNLNVLQEYEKEILEALNWLNKDLVNWLGDLNHLNRVIEENRIHIE